MQSPYTSSPFDAFMAAEASVSLALGALIVFRPARSGFSRALLLLALLLAVVDPVLPELAHGLGHPFLQPGYLKVLDLSAAAVSLAMLFSSSRLWLLVPALLGETALFRADRFLVEQNWEISALHVAWIGAFVGLETMIDTRPERPAPDPSTRSHLRTDLVLGALATTLAAIVSVVVLQRGCDSADEWAYTFQAAVFAKLHAYGATPPCYPALQNFWVFEKGGHVFSQYLPGWPLFMAPFVALGAAWLAGPFSLGVLVVGIARLARRGAAASIELGAPRAESQVRLAGIVAAVATMLSDTVLINGGSRFPHIWICATFAWSVESICILTSPSCEPRRQLRWGVVLGVSLAWLLSTRHVDGAVLGFGLFVYVLQAFVRSRLGLRAIVATSIPFVLFGALTLLILRLQLGTWFTTGYSLSTITHPWNKFTVSMPKPHEWRWGFPIAVGSYCWWPLAPSIGIAGLLSILRTRERRISFMLAMGSLLSLAFYSSLEVGRGVDFGYGPRYQLILVVPMAVGTGIIFAGPFAAAFSRLPRAMAFFEGGPAAVAVAAAILGILRIAPLTYPLNFEDVHNRTVVFQAIKKQHVSHAIVWVKKGTTMSDWLDLTQNLPTDLYVNDVLVVSDRDAEVRQCVKEHWPGRASWHTQGVQDVTLVPE